MPTKLILIAAPLALVLSCTGAIAANLGEAGQSSAAGASGQDPPGAPCGSGPGVGAGNPCNGNNGNQGAQGNVRIRTPSPPIILDMPAVSGRGAFIEQVGDNNRAGIEQTAPSAYARVAQTGNGNVAGATQGGSGTSYLSASQTGDANGLSVAQGGVGQNVLFTQQTGNRNLAMINQTAGAGLHNGAIVGQSGEDNLISLEQDGSDNRAQLSQVGDKNEMSVVQLGEGNRITWTQEGTNNSNLGITQTGAGSLLITQSRPN